MREVNRSALVPYSPQQMFALVDDIESYPQFVPWVKTATVLERSAQEVVATLGMVRTGIHERFTTRNMLVPFERIEMRLVNGPFRVLQGTWSFTPIQAGEDNRGTRIGFNIRFEFKNAVLGLMLSSSFEASCNSLVDSFTRRAREVYESNANLS